MFSRCTCDTDFLNPTSLPGVGRQTARRPLPWPVAPPSSEGAGHNKIRRTLCAQPVDKTKHFINNITLDGQNFTRMLYAVTQDLVGVSFLNGQVSEYLYYGASIC